MYNFDPDCIFLKLMKKETKEMADKTKGTEKGKERDDSQSLLISEKLKKSDLKFPSPPKVLGKGNFGR